MPSPLSPGQGTYLPLSVISTLVQNFFDMTQKKDPATGESRDLKPGEDSYNIWFSKKEIDDLFAANIKEGESPDAYGLRVYLCQHWDTQEEMEKIVPAVSPVFDYTKFKGQHGVALVVTKKDEAGVNNDLLSDENSVSLSATAATGLDVGQPCPPPAICLGVKVIPA